MKYRKILATGLVTVMMMGMAVTSFAAGPGNMRGFGPRPEMEHEDFGESGDEDGLDEREDSDDEEESQESGQDSSDQALPPRDGMMGGPGGPGQDMQAPPEKPEGDEGQQPPEKPEGDEGQQPPEKPEGDEGQQPSQMNGAPGQMQVPTQQPPQDGQQQGQPQQQGASMQQPGQPQQQDSSMQQSGQPQQPGSSMQQPGQPQQMGPQMGAQMNGEFTPGQDMGIQSGSGPQNGAMGRIPNDLLVDGKVVKLTWNDENEKNVTVDLTSQKAVGDISVEEGSVLVLNIASGSAYTGSINTKGEKGQVSVVLAEDATWTLTGDTYVSSFDGDISCVTLSGHTLYVNGEAYTG